MIPAYLKNHVTDLQESDDGTVGILVSSSGNTDLEIHYHGDVRDVGGAPYITAGELPCLITARDPATGEEFTVFDAAKHGCNALFCDPPADCPERELRRFAPHTGKVRLYLGYGIDYEEEREDYSFDENGNVILMYGVMPWEEAKAVGFDWISLTSADTGREFFSYETA